MHVQDVFHLNQSESKYNDCQEVIRPPRIHIRNLIFLNYYIYASCTLFEECREEVLKTALPLGINVRA